MARGRVRFKPSAARGFLFLVVAGASLSWAAFHRHWSDFLLYSYVAALPLGAVFMFGEGHFYLDDAPTAAARRLVVLKLLIPVPLVAVFMAPIGAVLYSFVASMVDITQWLATEASQKGKSPAYAVTVTGLLGIMFFVFRLRYRCVYGLSEAIVGLMVARNLVSASARTESEVALYFAMLTAGVYLVVRGLDNVHQGWKARSDPVASWFLNAVGFRDRPSPPPERPILHKRLQEEEFP